MGSHKMTGRELEAELVRVIRDKALPAAIYYGGREPELPMFKNRHINVSGNVITSSVNGIPIRITVEAHEQSS